jgi:hypothetical protein
MIGPQWMKRRSLSQPHALQTIAEAEADFAAGRTVGEEEIRNEFGVPPWQG